MQIADKPSNTRPPEALVRVKPVKPPQKTLNHPIFVAKYDYSAGRVGDLSFKKGDLLCVMSKEGDWWYARALSTGVKGYVPRNFILDRTLSKE